MDQQLKRATIGIDHGAALALHALKLRRVGRFGKLERQAAALIDASTVIVGTEIRPFRLSRAIPRLRAG